MTIETAEELVQLGEMLREARPLLKDLKRAKKEAEETVHGLMREEVQKAIKGYVEKELEAMGVEIQGAMAAAVDKVQREFDKLSDLLLGLDAKNRKAGNPSMEQLVADAVTRALEGELLKRAAADPGLRVQILKEMGRSLKGDQS